MIRHKSRAVSSVVGNVLLVAIVFIMGSAFAGIILTSDFEPTPEATIDIQQTNKCELGESECTVKVRVEQMDNADYVISRYVVTPGTSVPDISTDLVINEVPENAPSKPENTGSLRNETASVNVGGNNVPLASLLYGAGDEQIAKNVEVGTKLTIYAGIEGNERVIDTYTVQRTEA